jgi:hypothetical protein
VARRLGELVDEMSYLCEIRAHESVDVGYGEEFTG